MLCYLCVAFAFLRAAHIVQPKISFCRLTGAVMQLKQKRTPRRERQDHGSEKREKFEWSVCSIGVKTGKRDFLNCELVNVCEVRRSENAQ